MSDTVQLIKEKLTINDVVGQYVKLTRAGKYWKGLSPFTKEKTPSFFVSPDRGLYHCFSTGKGGDMFTFVEEMEGVDFKGALKLLAEKAGVPLSYEKGARDDRELLFKALEEAQNFFVEMRKANPEVDTYLTNRGLKKESIETWGVGYAPLEWQALHGALLKKGMTESVLERAGLVKKADREDGKASNRVYDRFRGRVMFPIRDVSGRVIGFSGRILKEDPNKQEAKYLNSPETAVFDKSKALYGIYEARDGMRSLNSAILVEGQMDLLMTHQAGYRNAVATSGTAFTNGHADMIGRYTKNLLIAYDGDRAGVSAAGRAASIALPAGMNVKVARFPAGEDPADVIRKNPDGFKAAIKEAVHIVDFYLAYLTDAKYDPRTFRLEVSRTVLPYISLIPNKIDQAHFVQRVSDALSVPEDAVLEEVKKLQKGATKPASKEGPLPASTEPFISRADNLERLALGFLLLFTEKGNTAEAARAETVLKETVGADRLELIRRNTDEMRAAVFEADVFLSEREEDAQMQAVSDVYADLEREARHEKYREALSRLRTAEKAGDEKESERLMEELSRLALTLH